LIWTSEYFQHFHLNIQYKSDKMNIISDTLSRLTNQTYHSEMKKFILETLHSSNVFIYLTFSQTFLNFQQQMMNRYKESHWKQIKKMIQANEALKLNAARLSYVMIWDLIYYKNIEKDHQLCISSILYHEIFSLAHDSMNHSEYMRTHKKLTKSLYIQSI
jgi:hypothetical protein